jgi:hypothetical protein
MRIKSFRLFESVDTDELLSLVKDMLRELDFNDLSHRAVIRRMDGREFIRVIISKPTTLVRFYGGQYIKDAFQWNDVEGVVNPIIDFLSEEGFEWYRHKGTLSSHTNEPKVVSSGSVVRGCVTKLEMWFVNKKTLYTGNIEVAGKKVVGN